MTIAFGDSASLANTLANRPAPSIDQIGRFFLDTATGQIYRDTGTTWLPVRDAIADRPRTGALIVQSSDEHALQVVAPIGTGADELKFPSTPVLDDFNRANEGPPPSANWVMPETSDDGVKIYDNAAMPNSPYNSCEALWVPLPKLRDTDTYLTTRAAGTQDTTSISLFARVQDNDSLYTGSYQLQASKQPGQPAKISLNLNCGSSLIKSEAALSWSLGDSFGLRVITENNSQVRLHAYHKPAGGNWAEVFSVIETTALFMTGAIAFSLGSNNENPAAWPTIDDFGGGEIVYTPTNEQFNINARTGEVTVPKLKTPSTALVENLNAEFLGGHRANEFAPAGSGGEPDLDANYDWAGIHRFEQTPQIHSTTEANVANLLYQDIQENGNGPTFAGLRAAGNEAAPAAVVAETTLARFTGRGYDGANWPSAATGGMEVVATEDHAPGHHGTRLKFRTTLNSTDNHSDHVTIENDGTLKTDAPLIVSTPAIEGPAEFDEETSDPLNLLSGYEGIVGVTLANTNNGTLYFKVITSPNGEHLDAKVQIFSDANCVNTIGLSFYYSEDGPAQLDPMDGQMPLSGTINLVVREETIEPITARWKATIEQEEEEVFKVDTDTGQTTIKDLVVPDDHMIDLLNAQYLGGNEASDFQPAIMPQENVAVTVEAIHAALVTLGFFTE
jgi:hypothetical protein